MVNGRQAIGIVVVTNADKVGAKGQGGGGHPVRVIIAVARGVRVPIRDRGETVTSVLRLGHPVSSARAGDLSIAGVNEPEIAGVIEPPVDDDCGVQGMETSGERGASLAR